MAQTKMKVDIWSDVMCPFCYIGKRHYEAALEKSGLSAHIETEWHSFQLDPTIPESASNVSIYAYLAARKGMDADTSKRMHADVTRRAAEAGLVYNFDTAVVVNSFRAHKLIQYAKTLGRGDEMEEALFRAYFTDGRNVGDTDTLVALAVALDIPEEGARHALDSEDMAYAVKQDTMEAEQTGISGVPFFVLDRRYAVSGAQPVATFVRALQQAYATYSQS